MNPDLCSFWILLYMNDSADWYVMDEHFAQCPKPKLLPISSPVTTSSNIKKGIRQLLYYTYIIWIGCGICGLQELDLRDLLYIFCSLMD